MAFAYTKDFLLDAYISRFVLGGIDVSVCENLLAIASKFYDKVGKDKFRDYASLDAAAIRKYRESSMAM